MQCHVLQRDDTNYSKIIICFIYDLKEHSKSPQAEEVTLLPVPSEYFAIAEGIKDDTTLVQFCNDLKLRKNKFGLCLELDRVNLESEQIRDVFVVDKVGFEF